MRPSLRSDGGPASAGYSGGRDRLDDLRRQDAVRVDEDLEGDAGRLGRDRREGRAGDRVDEVVGRAEGEGDGAVHLRELEDFGLLGGDRQDDDLLLAVQGRVGLRRRWPRGVGCSPSAGGAGGGSRVPMTCMPWSRSLTLVLLRPVTTVIELSVGLIVMTGNLSRGQADDHVDVVTGLDDRPDAADLVDLDRHGSAGSRGSRRLMIDPGWSAAEGRRRDLGALGDRLAGDLADDLRRDR